MKYNLLVISDLHLSLNYSKTVEEELCSFLEFHAEQRHKGLPWRLIINGDLFEFIGSMPLRFADKYVQDEGYIEQVTHLLKSIMETYKKFFIKLAMFIAAGNRLLIIKGNHDPELSVPEVFQSFKDTLFKCVVCRKYKFSARIEYEPYGYFEHKRLYVEHGHMYDVFCTWRVNEDHSHDLPLGTYSARGFRSYFNIPLDQMEMWSGKRIFMWLFQKKVSWKLILFFPVIYGRIIYTLFKKYRKYTRSEKNIPEEFKELSALWADPGYSSLTQISGAIYLDKVLLVVLSILVAAFMGGWFGFMAAVGLYMFGSVICSKLFPRYEVPLIQDGMHVIAKKVEELMEVPLVVFGHCHRPVNEPGYINTGSWLPNGEFTYFMRTSEPGALLRWDTNTDPRPF